MVSSGKCDLLVDHTYIGQLILSKSILKIKMRPFLPFDLFNQFLGLVHLTDPQTSVQYN